MLKFAKVEDKVSQVMVKKVNKPITTTQIVIMINQPKVQRRKRKPLSMFFFLENKKETGKKEPRMRPRNPILTL